MADLPTGMSMGKIPISTLVMIFVIYLVIHIVIAVMLKKKQEEFDNMSIEHSDYSDLRKTVKIISLLYKWFPAIAIVLIVLGFYL